MITADPSVKLVGVKNIKPDASGRLEVVTSKIGGGGMRGSVTKAVATARHSAGAQKLEWCRCMLKERKNCLE